MIIFAASNGYLEDVHIDHIKAFEKELYSFMDTHFPEIGKEIKESGKLVKETEEKLKSAIVEFKVEFSNGP